LAPPTSRSRRSHLPAAVGILISVLLLWWALHDVSLREVWHEIRSARLGWLIAAAAGATLTFPLRTIRWRYLLRDQGTVLPLAPLWHATAIGFMANNLLPARAGEVARAYAARSLTGVRFTTALASVAVERVFDGLFLVGLLVVGFLGGGFTTAATIQGMPLSRIAIGGAALFGSMFVVALVVVWQPVLTRRLAHAVLQRLLPAHWADRMLALVDGLLDGLSALRAPGRLGAVLFWSLILWLTNAGSFVLAFVAFDLSLPWGAALVLQGLLAFGVAVPSTPGFFGVFEGVTRASLALYGVAASSAVSMAIGYHILGFVPITVLGLWSLWRANLHIRDLRRGGDAAGATGTAGTTGEREDVRT
jgi:hypothetical protein